MTDTYEFLKAQKDAILAKKEADENEWLKAAAEDIAHYKQERDLALAECERLRADAERWKHLKEQYFAYIDDAVLDTNFIETSEAFEVFIDAARGKP